MNARLYLVCGLPGAGKTTRARAISASTRAIRLCPDEWLEALGANLLDYELRFRLEPQMLRHGEELLLAGVGIVVEFGSWTRKERETIRQVGVRAGAATELHFMDASLQELIERVQKRGGEHAPFLVDKVLRDYASAFERPTTEEIFTFDRYVGPTDVPDL